MKTLQTVKLVKKIRKSANTTKPTAILIDGQTVNIRMTVTKAGLFNSGYLTVSINGVDVVEKNVYDEVIYEHNIAEIIDKVALKIANIKLFGE